MANVLIKFKGDTSDIKGDIAGIKKESKGLGAVFNSAGGALTAAFAGAGAIKALQFASSAVTSFTNLEESLNAVKVQFGEGADAILAFGETAAESVGLANSEFNQLATVTGATLSGFIKSEEEAAEATIKLTQRAADMASVFNTDVSVALEALQSAVRGESEPIRRFGVQLDDATVKAKAVELGLAATTAEVDLQAKGLARLEIIYEQTNKTAGDFANTSDSVANKMKVLGAKFEDAKASIGEALIPAVEELLDLIDRGLPLVGAFADTISQISFAVFGRDLDELNAKVQRTNELMAEGLGFREATAQADREASDAQFDLIQTMEDWNRTTAESVAVRDADTVAAEREKFAIDALGDAFKESAFFGAAFAKAQGRAATDVEKLIIKLEGARQKVMAFAREQAAAADPVINLIRRTEDHKQALADLTKTEDDHHASTEDLIEAQLRVVETGGELQLAQDTVRIALDESTEGFLRQAEAAGLAADAAERLLGILTQFPATETGGFGGQGGGPGGGDRGFMPGVDPGFDLGVGGRFQSSQANVTINVSGGINTTDPAELERFIGEIQEGLDQRNAGFV